MNYYWYDGFCACCKRAEVYHVGKASAGWSFLFRSYGTISREPSPFGFEVFSRDCWRLVFRTRPGKLFDESGTEITDPVAWVSGVRAPGAEQQAWEREQYLKLPELALHLDEILDYEGFRFVAHEFS